MPSLPRQRRCGPSSRLSSPIRATVLFAALAIAALTTPMGYAKNPGPTAVSRTQNQGVTIKRDEYGTPHVYASTVYGLFYGYGYAVAQDRLFQMEMAKRSTQGTVSEVLGEKFVSFDQSIRGNYWPASIHRQIEALPQKERDILEGYAAGMNAWIEQVRAQPQVRMPKQFNDFDFQPSSWDAFDVAMVFVGTMANRFSDATSEIDNLALLTALNDRYGKDQGMALFNTLKWIVNPDAPTTVPAAEGSYPIQWGKAPSVPGETVAMQDLPRFDGTAPMQNRLAKGSDGVLLHQDEANNAQTILAQFEASGPNGLAGYPTTSNMWIVGKNKARDAKAIMLNGPQFGWFAPAYTVGIGLHGAGFDLVGNTPFGYPAILFGHNGKISWGSTAGFGDDIDIYAEKLDPQNRERYFYKGQWRQMEKRVEVVRVKGGAPVVQEVYRTVHGIVMQRDEQQHIAYAKARAWAGQELQSLLAWTHQARAQDWASWTAQAAKHALTINWYYADQAGNIGYVHTGAYPERRPGHDPRLPVPGTGEWDWKGLLPFATNPKVYNPRQGWIANWNNSPQKGYPASDLFAFLWGGADRVAEIDQRITTHASLSTEDMWNILRETSAVDVNRQHFLPFIERAAAKLPADDGRRQIVALLQQWDGINRDPQHTGHYDTAGSAIMDAWLTAMLQRTLGVVVPQPYNKWFSASGYAAPQDGPTGSANISNGAKVLHEALRKPAAGGAGRFDIFSGAAPDDVVNAALQDVRDKLGAKWGANSANWRTPTVPLTFRAANFFGVPQSNSQEAVRTPVYMNRGTENDLIVFGAKGSKRVLAYDVVAPGQSGFVAPDGTPSPHYADQLKLYTEFGRKPLWHDSQDVQRQMRSTEQLTLPRR